MEPDEQEICLYLKMWRDQFLSAREISRRAGGKWRYRENADWAVPVLIRLTEKGLVEKDPSGHYRIVTEKENEKKKQPKRPTWIAPHVQKILAKAGMGTGNVQTFELGQPDGFYPEPPIVPPPSQL
jgi:hypothetical protein